MDYQLIYRGPRFPVRGLTVRLLRNLEQQKSANIQGYIRRDLSSRQWSDAYSVFFRIGRQKPGNLPDFHGFTNFLTKDSPEKVMGSQFAQTSLFAHGS
jgi:hypothetical protein